MSLEQLSKLNEGMDLPEIKRSIIQENINLYAEASQDFNPIHIDEEFAKKNSPPVWLAIFVNVATSAAPTPIVNTFTCAAFRSGITLAGVSPVFWKPSDSSTINSLSVL